MFLLCKMKQKAPWTRPGLWTDFFQLTVRSQNRLLSAKPPNDFAPLICRVVRAVLVLGAGLGFPVGETFGFAPPTSDIASFNLILYHFILLVELAGP